MPLLFISGPLLAANVQYYDVPQGDHPHDVAPAPDGTVWYTGQYKGVLGRLDPETGKVKVFPPPKAGTNANLNAAAFDAQGHLWFTGQAGTYGRLDPATGDMDVWNAPKGRGPYGITGTPSGDIYYVSVSDFTANAILSFDPESETFDSFPSDRPGAAVRQMLGRPGEVWGAESGTDRLVVIRENGKEAWD